jgi:hypothetical protein
MTRSANSSTGVLSPRLFLVTAYPEDPGVERAAELGATDVFRKGNLDLHELLATVEEKLRGRAVAPMHFTRPPSAHA